MPPPGMGSCWSDRDCTAGKKCTGAQLCPCGANCLLPDQPGYCS
jgi:hypothetical protein